MVSYANQCGPQVEITPPDCTSRRYGLFSAADIREVEDGNWSHGIRYRSESCTGNVYAWPRPCPPCGVQDCTDPLTITVEVERSTTRIGCVDISRYAARLTGPLYPDLLPPGTVVTVCTSCDIGCVELSQSATPPDPPAWTVMGALPAPGGDPGRVTFTVRESATGTQASVTIEGNNSATLTLTIEPGRENHKKVLDGLGPWTGVDPFPVYSSVHCMPGAGFVDEAKRIAEDRMRANEECAVENWLWNDFLLQGADRIPGGTDSDPLPLNEAIGRLEAALAARRGNCTGVIHLPAETSFPLSAGGCCMLDDDGSGTLRTRLGTAAAFGACYDSIAQPNGMPRFPNHYVLVGTGPVIVQRGPISTYEGLDQWTNDYAAISERTYAVITDCPLVWITAAKPS